MKKIICTSKRLLSLPQSNFSELAKFQNNFLSTTNVEYIESMYAKWVQDKASVSQSLSTYFELMEQGEDPETAFVSPPKSG
jgi:2-oxoglutarate dehydrogenase complex dehydrogenase (E1) component-like enzyme